MEEILHKMILIIIGIIIFLVLLISSVISVFQFKDTDYDSLITPQNEKEEEDISI